MEGELRRTDRYREALDFMAITYITNSSSRNLRVVLNCFSQRRMRLVP